MSPAGTCKVSSKATDGRETHWRLELHHVEDRVVQVSVDDPDGGLSFTFDTKDPELGPCVGTVVCDTGVVCDCVAEGAEAVCDSDDLAQTATCAGYVPADETWNFDICEC